MNCIQKHHNNSKHIHEQALKESSRWKRTFRNIVKIIKSLHNNIMLMLFHSDKSLLLPQTKQNHTKQNVNVFIWVDDNSSTLELSCKKNLKIKTKQKHKFICRKTLKYKYRKTKNIEKKPIQMYKNGKVNKRLVVDFTLQGIIYFICIPTRLTCVLNNTSNDICIDCWMAFLFIIFSFTYFIGSLRKRIAVNKPQIIIIRWIFYLHNKLSWTFPMKSFPYLWFAWEFLFFAISNNCLH